MSMRLFQDNSLHKDAAILATGCGSQTSVDDLLDKGDGHVTVLNLSGVILLESRRGFWDCGASDFRNALYQV